MHIPLRATYQEEEEMSPIWETTCEVTIAESELTIFSRNVMSSVIRSPARSKKNWGCPEVVITQVDGVSARVERKTSYERFSNRSVV